MRNNSIYRISFYPPYIAEGIGHSLSYSPMKDNRHDILSFLNRLVLGKEKRCITTVEKNPEISRYKSDFTIEDYIRENMDGGGEWRF